jgi:ubiquinone/menaquinone biosynthesis C-methylase UbiE
MSSEVEIQRRYYAENAERYNDSYGETDEHYFALAILVSVVQFFDIKSILDLGSGTGRAVEYVKRRCPGVKIVGIEPVKELREIAYRKGISREELIEGNALKLPFKDGEFDMVCEFGVLHHVRTPEVIVAEMLRVAKKIIFISDANNFGQGSFAVRTFKQVLNMFGLWKAVYWMKTKGKGYTISEGDGLAYSYSVFNNYKQIEEKCSRISLLNTTDGRIDPYRTASHIVLMGVKR